MSAAADGVPVMVPLEHLKRLSDAAEGMGISLPGVARMAPTIDIGQPIRTLALEMGRILARQNLFLKANELVTIERETGEVRPMKPARFVGWCEEFVAIRNSAEKNARQSLSREVASLVIEQDIFRSCIRPLQGVHLMRLPVRREDGSIEFLDAGYDEASQIYTVDTLPYAMDWTLDQAREFLLNMTREFPWNVPDPKEGETRLGVEESRSLAVHIAAIVGTYCKAMMAPASHRPMIAYIANQAGSGKSLLASMALTHVHGEVAPTQVPKDDKEMNSQLDTMARNLAPYVFFDDIGYGITSSPLNQFITSSFRQGRVMGGNSEIFKAPVLAQVLVTGNDINISDDLRRRALVAELFLAGEVQGRQFKQTISETYLARPEVRGAFLASCCALVRHWAGACATSGRPSLHPKPLASFDEWTGTVGAIVVMGGFADPLQAPELTVGTSGDSSDDIRELLLRLAVEQEKDAVFSRKDLVTKAREWGLLEGVLGTVEDEAPDSKASKRFGKQLSRWRARQLVDEKGRRFEFGHRRQKGGMTYPLRFIEGAPGQG